jgi:sterol 3beta-glucosyltransferase
MQTYRIGIQTWGSDGDILPFFGLAKALVASGHRVTIAVTSVDGKDYRELGLSIGAEVQTVNGSALADDPYALSRASSPLVQLRALLATCYDPMVGPMYDASVALCGSSDVVVGHALCHTLHTAAELAAVPRVSVALSPMLLPTAHLSPNGRRLPTPLNRFLWWAGDRVMSALLFGKADELRVAHGLRPLRSLHRELYSSDFLTLLACSPALCSPMPDWPDTVRVVGQLLVPADIGAPSDALLQFMAQGAAPVFMTFGSCAQFNADEDLRLLTDAAMRAGVRAVIQMDGVGEGTPSGSSDVFVCGRADHAAIFPKCAAVVHHGGAGTAHAVLRAGVPSVVVAHAYDQTDWADRLYRAGVAPRPLHRKRVTVAQLAEAIHTAVKSTSIISKAKGLGERVACESGVDNAVRLITTAMQQRG